MTFAQERLWFIDQFAPGDDSYNVPIVLRLDGELDIDALNATLTSLVLAHEALRTRMGVDGHAPCQVVDMPWNVTLSPLDLAQADLCATLSRLAAEPFDLIRDRLARLALLRLSAHQHVLVMTLHHIVCDGWSADILLRDMGRVYGQCRAGTHGAIRPGPQSIDIAVAERARLSETKAARLTAYWRTRLQGAPDILELPADLPGAGFEDKRAAEIAVRLPGVLVSHVDQLGREHDATPFMVLLTAFNILLARWCRRETIILGTPVANRGTPLSDQVVSHVANTLALRTDLAMREGFANALYKVREAVIEDFAHQDLPFEKLVEALQPQRVPGVNPLFQVMFVMHAAPPATVRLGDIDVSLLPVPASTAKFPLTLTLTRTTSGLDAVFEYAAASFSAAMMRRMAAHFENLLWSIVGDPDGPIAELAMLSAAETALLIGPPPAPPEPVAECVHQIVARWAADTPDAIAVVDGETALSYAALNARAGQVANVLIKHGVGPETLVALCVPRSAEMIIGLLGILQAGGAYLPIDPHYPAERIAFMLADSGVDIVLTVAETAHVAAGYTGIDMCAGMDAGMPAEVAVTPANLAYVIYTSGSTGRPKGVMVEHAQIMRLFRTTAAQFAFTREDVWSLFHAISFDFSVWEIWGALLHGGRLVVVPHWTTRTPALFHDLIVKDSVTILNQTPSAFRELARIDGEKPGMALAGLRTIIFGGEKLESRDVLPWLERYGADRPILVNMYGITETTVHVTYRRLGLQDSGPRSPIGRPLDDLDVILLDAYLQPVPIGVTGEMFVGGQGLARGYLGRPELTAERFMESPFHPGRRLYRSGDLARRSETGELDYLGRMDEQVKIRGFRIELGEINAALSRHPDLAQAQVLVEEDADLGKHLVAYCVARDAPLLAHELRTALMETLPDFMIPSRFVFLPALPLTLNGKLDRTALSAARAAADVAPAVTHYEAPQGRVEQALASVLASVLGVGQVSRKDHFFGLGGDSIRALRVCAAAADLGLEVSLPDVFQASDLADLAMRASDRTGTPDHISTLRFALLPDTLRARLAADPAIADAYPVSRLQEGMLFHSLWTKGCATYHDVFWAVFDLALDTAMLVAALQRLIGRHEILRTAFDLGAEEMPVQIVYQEVEAVIVEQADPASLQDWVKGESEVGFRIGVAPLFRCFVHRTSDRAFRFVLSCHHAIIDGWSLASLVAQLEEDYAARVAGTRAKPHPKPATRYVDFIAAEQSKAADPTAIAFWRASLNHMAQCDPGRRFVRALDQQAGTFVRTMEITQADIAALQSVSRRHGVAFRIALLAAHCRMLRALRGVDRVVTGLVVNGRLAQGGGDQVAGLFLNTIPICVSAGSPDWPALMRQCAAQEQAAFPHRIFPLADMKRLNGNKDVFDVLFNYTNFHIFQRAGTSIRQNHAGGFERTNFPLALSANLDPLTGALSVSLQVWRGVLPEEAARLALKVFARVLCAIGSDAANAGFAEQLLASAEHELYVFLNEHQDDGFDASPSNIEVTESSPIRDPLASEALLPLFRAVLKTERFDVHDDFFAFGGDSLLALRLCQRLGAKSGIDIPPSVLFEYRSAAAMQGWLQRNGSTEYGEDAPSFEKDGLSHAICFMPAIVGSAIIHDPLARALASYGHPVLCSLPGREIDEIPLVRMEQMGSHCAAQIVAAHPGKEYTLVGWSFGGILALETARQLVELGLAVRQLILIDSYLPASNAEFAEAAVNVDDYPIMHELKVSDLAMNVAKASLQALWAYDAPICTLPLNEIRASHSMAALLPSGSHFPVRAVHRVIDIIEGDHYSIMGPDGCGRLAVAVTQAISLGEARLSSVFV